MYIIFRIVTYLINNFYIIFCLFVSLCLYYTQLDVINHLYIILYYVSYCDGEPTTQDCCTSQLYTHIRSLNHFGTNTQFPYLGSFNPPPQTVTSPPVSRPISYLKSLGTLPLKAITSSLKHHYKTTLLITLSTQ